VTTVYPTLSKKERMCFGQRRGRLCWHLHQEET